MTNTHTLMAVNDIDNLFFAGMNGLFISQEV